MKTLNYFFFYTYIGLVILAGFWGAFLGADLDHQLLLGLDTSVLTDETRANVLTQYRFLRAMELGFGLFAIVFRNEIFTVKKFNALFLVIMLAGVLARIVSLFADGSPSWIFYFFMIYEGIGVVIIYLYSRKPLEQSP
ncbi:DUF4345 family protein [Fodinibius sp.]|uniref:DUF4345 family protein n=1 Tax=Fodinibius sp. TaxID=1872440 RepID=UPI0035686EA2